MPRKTKIIFIVVFILVGAITLSAYFYMNKGTSSSTGDTTIPGYQPFLGGGTTQPINSDGSTTNNNVDQNTNTNNPDTIQAISGPSKLHRITDYSVAGATFFEDTRPLIAGEVALTGGKEPLTTTEEKPATTKKVTTPKPKVPDFEIVPSIRYVERVTGHINQMYLDTKVVGQVSNSTVPNIYEVLFDGKASSVLYRYLGGDGKTITSYLATLGSTDGEFLPSDILDVSISPDKSKFFYLTKTFSGVVGSTRSFKDTKKTQVFSSSISEWLSQWVTDQKIYLTTKASYSVDGGLFSLNTTSGVLSKIFGGVRGLTTLANKDGSSVLYSSSTSSGPRLFILTVSTHTSVDINTYGLPEKCVWSNDNINIYCALPGNINGLQYPDMWYQGLASFTDRFVKINKDTLEITTIEDSVYETPVDGTNLFLDKQEKNLFFINKKDSTFWSLDLN